MQIVIKHYGQTFTWENEFGPSGIGNAVKLDETNLSNVMEVFAALLIAAGWSEQTIKECMYEYGSQGLSEEV